MTSGSERSNSDEGTGFRLLVIGGTGMVGAAVGVALAAQARSTARRPARTDEIRFDPMIESLGGVVDFGDYDAALIAFGVTDTLACALNPSETAAVNVDATLRVVHDCHLGGVKPIFLSSDAVFDGRKGDYTESDVANPLLTYGLQKLEVERYLAEHVPEALTLRLPRLFNSRLGFGIPGRWLEMMRTGQEIRLATDQRYSPLHVDDLVASIRAAVSMNLSGLYHVGGDEPVTSWELFHQLANYLPGPSRSYVATPALINDFATTESRPINTTLDSNMFFSLTGLPRKPLPETCREIMQVYVAQTCPE